MESIENFSLAKIVTLKPEASSLLEKHKLDFCCGGKKTLVDALKHNPEELKEVVAKLKKLFENENTLLQDFTKLSPTELVDYILDTHHSYVRENLPTIKQHLEKVSFKHGEKNPEMAKIKLLFDELVIDFEQHMMKEENILFPLIKKLDSMAHDGGIKNLTISALGPIQMMEAEHEKAGSIMEEIRILSNEFTPPEDACTTFRLSLNELKIFETDLHQHVHLENNILFPKVMELQEKYHGLTHL